MAREIKIPITVVPGNTSNLKQVSDALRDTQKAVDSTAVSLRNLDKATDTANDSLAEFARESKVRLDGMKKQAEDLQSALKNSGNNSNGDTGLKSTAKDAKAATDALLTLGRAVAPQMTAAAKSTAELASSFSTLSGGIGSVTPGMVAFVGGAVAIGAAAVGTVAYLHSLTAEFGKAAEESLNMADRLGISVGEVEKLQAMAKIAGINIGTLESSARLLGQALEDSSGSGKRTADALQKMGIGTQDYSGKARDMGRVLLDVLANLAAIPNTAERVARANETLGRGAKELMPLILNLSQLRKTVDELGVGVDENMTRKLGDADDEAGKLDIKLNLLKKTLASKWAPVQISVYRTIIDVLNGKTSLTTPNEAVVSGNFGGTKSPFDAKDDRVFGPEHLQEFVRSGLDGSHNLMGAAGAKNVEAVGTAIQQQSDKVKSILANTVDGMQQKLTELKEKATELRTQLSKPLGVSTSEDKLSELNSTNTQIEAIEARIKSIRQLPEELKSLQRELAKTQADELHGVEKINALRKAELELKGHTAQEQDLINQKFDIQIKQELVKESIQKRQLDLAFQLKSASIDLKDDPRAAAYAEASLKIQAALFEFEKTRDTQKLQLDITKTIQERTLSIAQIGSAESDRARKEKQDSIQALTQFSIKSRGIGAKDENADARIQADYEDRVREIRAVEVRNDQDRAARRKSFADAAIDYELAKEELAAKRKAELDKFRIDQLKTAADYQIKVVEATAQPGQEQQVVERVAQIRITAAKEQYDLTHDRLQLEREVEAALYEAQSKRLDMQKKSLDDFKSAAGQLYDELLNKGGRGIGDFFKKQFEDAGRRVFENLAGKLFEKLPGLPDMKDQAGGIFRDVWGPLGKGGKNAPAPGSPGSIQAQAKAITDQYAGQQIQSTSLNTAATDRNTAALTRLTAQIGSGAGLAGMGGTAGLGSLVGLGGISHSIGSAAAGGTQVSSTLMTDDGTVFGSGTTVTPAGGGFWGWNGQADYGGVGGYNPATGTMQAASSAASSKTSSLGKGLGTGVAIGAGALGVYSGIKQGGARGYGQAAASGLGTAAALDPEPVSKSILAGAAIVTGLITSLFGPNLAKRNNEIDKQIRGNAFFDRPTYQRNEDAYGSNVDFDYRGGLRTGAPAAMNVTMHISALDAKGVMEMGGTIADALKYQILRGHTVVDEIRQATR